MNLKRMSLIFNALMICLLSGSLMTAFAQRPGGGGPPAGGPPAGGPPMGGPPEFIERLLDLTDAQKEQIKAIRERAAEASKPHHEALKPLMEQQQALTEAASFDESAFRTLAVLITPIQIELQVIQARAQSETHNVLTAEQKAKLAEMRKRMEGRGGPGGGRPGGRPGGFGPPRQ